MAFGTCHILASVGAVVNIPKLSCVLTSCQPGGMSYEKFNARSCSVDALSDICNDAILDEQEIYLKKHVPDRVTVETAYDQKKVEEMSKALEDFWKERGINVGVRTTLAPIPKAPRYAALTLELYKR